MQKLKILQLLDTYYPIVDGPCNVVRNYSKNLNKDSVCKLAVPKAAKKEKYVDKEDFEVLRCRSISAPEKYQLGLPGSDKKFNKKIKQENFDIIHTHSPFTMGRYAIKRAKKQGVPCVATLHTQYDQDFIRVLKGSKPLVNFMMRYIMHTYHKADSVWTVNTASCEILRKYGYKGDIKVVKNGTDMVYPENATELINKVNDAHGLHNQKNVLVYVGRLAMYKNLPLMANALKILKDKGQDFKMLIVGGGYDEDAFKKMISELGLDDEVIFVGTVKDRALLQGYYLRSDLFLFPSSFDTCSLVPIEAAAHKLPTLLIDGSYTAEGITDGVNGFLAKETAEDYAEKIASILSAPETLKAVSEECHKSVYRTWEMVAKEVYEKYQEVIKEYNEKSNVKS
ncbi:MAG: glycosyltransferase [Clostridia bacterium]|nr:glycosyltransferase [Clostridia bacterium]